MGRDRRGPGQVRRAEAIVEDVPLMADAVGDVREVAKAHDVRVALRRLSPDRRVALFEMFCCDLTA